MLVRPSLGWGEVLFALLFFAASYGFMLFVGLPLHLLLRARSTGTFLFSLCLVAWIVVGCFTLVEGDPSPPIPDDNSPFAEMTLRGGGWLILSALWTPFVVLTGVLFVTLVHRQDEGLPRDVGETFD